MILGIDEVGRGCWAGPLVVGAVILGDSRIEGLTDSKALSKKRREQLDEEIRKKALAIGLGWVSASEIDELGLASSLRLATRRAVQQVQQRKVFFDEIIIDGTVNFLQGTALGKYVSVMKKADFLISSVSAASVVAKVARDDFMAEQAKKFPDFGFEDHVGYGTAKHRTAIDNFGVCELHRLSFAPLRKYQKINITGVDTSKDVDLKKVQTTKQIGDGGEAAACSQLEKLGHQIIDRNWRTKYCEIDIVSKVGDNYFFTEVKHRKNASYGDGLAAVTPAKLRQMRFAADLYAQKHQLTKNDLRLMAVATIGNPPIVIDVVEIL